MIFTKSRGLGAATRYSGDFESAADREVTAALQSRCDQATLRKFALP
jgi:hypothetical protein